MRRVVRDRSPWRRGLAVAVAAALWSGLSPGASPGAQAAEGRPGPAGTALAWGTNIRGELGDGATSGQSATPVRVCGAAPCTSPLDRVVAVAAGDQHTVALRADGSVWSWGWNGLGQLGDGSTTDRTTPVRVCARGETAPCGAFLTGVTAVAAGGAHSLALMADGTVVAWGVNASGQLGDDTTTLRGTPVQVCAFTEADCDTFPLAGVIAVAAGGNHSLALQSDGSVRSWGLNSNGQLGDDTTDSRDTPGTVSGLSSGVTAIAAGLSHSLAVLSDGTARAWGWNANGQLGDGTTTQRTTPVTVCGVGQSDCAANPLTGVRDLSAGSLHSLAALADRTARSWGGNGSGQLGDGTTTQRTTPVTVCGVGQSSCAANPLTGVTSVAGGGLHSVAVSSGTARSWGRNEEGQLGDGTTTRRTTPVKVCGFGRTAPCGSSLDGVTAIGTGLVHSVAVSRPSADLSIALSASPEPVAPGGTLTYTVTVRNDGPSNAENVVLRDTLPAEGRFVSATPSRGSCTVPPVGSTDTVRCSLGTLANTSQATTQIVVTVRAPAGGTVTNTATVTSSTPDPDQADNTATIRTPVS